MIIMTKDEYINILKVVVMACLKVLFYCCLPGETFNEVSGHGRGKICFTIIIGRSGITHNSKLVIMLSAEYHVLASIQGLLYSLGEQPLCPW